MSLANHTFAGLVVLVPKGAPCNTQLLAVGSYAAAAQLVYPEHCVMQLPKLVAVVVVSVVPTVWL